jgi:transposase-like protein
MKNDADNKKQRNGKQWWNIDEVKIAGKKMHVLSAV